MEDLYKKKNQSTYLWSLKFLFYIRVSSSFNP